MQSSWRGGTLKTAPESKLKLFLSYSRQDVAAADALVAALEQNGFEVFIDRRDIPGGEEWLAELGRAIALCDTVVWLVSASSVTSKACLWELGELQRQSKRLMPIALEPAASVELPEAIGKVHLLPAEGTFSIVKHLPQLIEALNTDRGWLKTHTRLLEAARHWRERSRSASFLLVGHALQDAQDWRDRQPRAMPAPNSAVLDLILASQQHSTRRQRAWVAGASMVAAIGLGLAALAFVQRQIAMENEAAAVTARGIASANEEKAVAAQKAEEAARLVAEQNEQRANEARQAESSARQAEAAQRKLADDNARKATENAALAQASETRAVSTLIEAQRNLSLFRARQAKEFVDRNDPTTAILIMLESLPDRSSRSPMRRDWPVVPDAVALLDRTAVANIAERQLVGHRSRVHRLEFDRFGRRLVTAGLDGAWLWDVEAGRAVAKLGGSATGQDAIVWRGTFSPDATTVVTAHIDGTIRRWNAETGELRGEFAAGERDDTRQVAFSPDGSRLALGGAAGVILRDVVSGKLIANEENKARYPDRSIPAPSFRTITELEFNRADTLLAAAGTDPTVAIYDARTGKPVRALGGHREATMTVSFSPLGDLVATGSMDGSVRVWDVAGFNFRRVIQIAEKGVVRVAFAPTDGRLLVVSADMVTVWDASRGERLRQMFHNGAVDAAWSSDGRTIASVASFGGVNVWDVASGTRTSSLTGSQSRQHVVAFSPDRRKIAVGSENGAVTLWPLDAGNPEAASATARQALDCRTLAWMPRRPSDRAFSDVESNNELIETPEEFATVIANATGLESYVARHANRQTRWHEVIAFDQRHSRAVTIAMSGNRQNWDQVVLVWDVLTRRVVKRLVGHRGRIHGAVFSPDGTQVLSYGDDKIARIWSLLSDGPPRELLGHEDIIFAGCFSGDGKLVATGGTDNTIRVWDIASLRVLQQRSSKLDGVWHLAFINGDRSIVAAGLADGPSNKQQVEEHRLSADTQELVDGAKAKVGRCLTPHERQQLLLDQEPPEWCVELKKSPYDTAPWHQWLEATRRGEMPKLPAGQ